MKKFVSLFGEHSELFDMLNDKASAYAAENGFDYLWLPQKPYDKEGVISALKESDVGLIDVEPYDESIFGQVYKRCKLLIRFGVGFDKVNLPDASKNGICIARTTGANATGVAEMALTLGLAARRNLLKNRKSVESGVWEKNVGSELLGKTVGIVGFGAVGQTLAKLLRGFECKILAFDPYPNLEKMAALNVVNSDLDTLTKESDMISIHSPYMPSTHNMFDAKRIGMMKRDAVLVCTARGNIVNEEALYDALKNGTIAGAGLDVYADEPLPIPSKLTELDNLILTPHVASQTKESLWAIYKKAIDLACDFYNGKQLPKQDLLNPDYNQ